MYSRDLQYQRSTLEDSVQYKYYSILDMNTTVQVPGLAYSEYLLNKFYVVIVYMGESCERIAESKLQTPDHLRDVITPVIM